jgi:hypothetical protein
MKTKKAIINPFSIGIILFLFLLIFVLFSDIETNNNSNDKYSYLNNKEKTSSITSIDEEIDPSKIFKLGKTYIGKEKTVVENSEYFELGAIERFLQLHSGSFNLKKKLFGSSFYYFEIPIENKKFLDSLLFYFEPEYLSGSDAMFNININNLKFIKTPIDAKNTPIKIKLDNTTKNADSLKIEISILNDGFFSFPNVRINDFKVLGKMLSDKNSKKDFYFQTNLRSIDELDLELIVRCRDKKEYGFVDISINENLIETLIPNCNLGEEVINIPIPLSILDGDKNKLTFETDSFFQISYNLNSKYLEQGNVYRFTINNFNDFLDIVVYGNFDKEVIDIKVNSKTLSLKKDEVLSIFPYLKIGVNQVKILTSPLEIEEFVVEKVDYYNSDDDE